MPRRRAPGAPAFVVLVVAAASVLAGSLAALGASLGRTDEGTWTWDGRIPGNRVDGDPTLERIARFGGVEPGSVREVIRLATSQGVQRVLAGRSREGRICFAPAAEGVWRSFSYCFPRPERIPSAHPLTPAWLAVEREAEPVLFHFRSEGGPEPRTVGWATIVGVARSDVTRIVATLPDASGLDLPLNEWRAFGYSSEPGRFPTALVAYGERRSLFGSDEYVIQQVPLGRTHLPRPAPLCGGEAGPCDAELDRLSRRARARASSRSTASDRR